MARMFAIGSSLREARIKRGLSPGDVHKAIRIRDRYLQALEEERWELLPGDAYVKGFLRTYAEFLGLDGGLYVDEYNSRFANHEEPTLAPQPLARVESHRGVGIGRLPALIALAIVVVAAVAIAAWRLESSPGASPTASSTSHHTKTGGGTTTHEKTHKRRHVALPTRAVLVAARGDCWLEVRKGGASGALVYEQTLQQGQSLPLRLTSGPLWIDVGDPPNLDVRLGGRIVPGLPTQTGNVLLTRHGLKPA